MMFALCLLAAMSLASHAAVVPMSYHALTDDATGSVLIFPAARSAPPPMGDLRGIPDDASMVKKDDETKGFLSSWWKPDSRPVGWQGPHPAPHPAAYHGHYDHYDPYYHNGAYPISGYPTRYPDRYNKYPDRYDKYPDKFNKWHGLVDKFQGLYYDKQDKVHGAYYDKYDKFDKYDKYDPHYHHHYYGPSHSGYQGLGWGVGGYHTYPNSDRPYEYGFEGGPYGG